MTATIEARYHRASRACHRAWLASQPQYVIPGLLDGLDEPQAREPLRFVEPADKTSHRRGHGGLDSRLAAGEAGAVTPPTAESAAAIRAAKSSAPAASRDRLDSGAEPCRDLRELTANRSYAAPPVSLPRAGGSAPLSTTTGPGAPPAKGTRPAQRRTV